VLRFSVHAREMMARRNITEREVEEAHRSHRVVTPGWTSDRINLWGTTEAGRRLRITTYRNALEFVISVVAPDEEVE